MSELEAGYYWERHIALYFRNQSIRDLFFHGMSVKRFTDGHYEGYISPRNFYIQPPKGE